MEYLYFLFSSRIVGNFFNRGKSFLLNNNKLDVLSCQIVDKWNSLDKKINFFSKLLNTWTWAGKGSGIPTSGLSGLSAGLSTTSIRVSRLLASEVLLVLLTPSLMSSELGFRFFRFKRLAIDFRIDFDRLKPRFLRWSSRCFSLLNDSRGSPGMWLAAAACWAKLAWFPILPFLLILQQLHANFTYRRRRQQSSGHRIDMERYFGLFAIAFSTLNEGI